MYDLKFRFSGSGRGCKLVDVANSVGVTKGNALSPIFSVRAKTGSETSYKKYSVPIPGELLETVEYPFAYPKRVVVLFR